MSTRCRIGIEGPDGSIESIYCYHDGYLSGVGYDLLHNFPLREQAQALVALGDVSGFSSPDDVSAYSRDRGESYEEVCPRTSVNREEYVVLADRSDAEWIYLCQWVSEDEKTAHWIVRKMAHRYAWEDLRQALAEDDPDDDDDEE